MVRDAICNECGLNFGDHRLDCFHYVSMQEQTMCIECGHNPPDHYSWCRFKGNT